MATPTQSERDSLAGRIQIRRRERFGSKAAAYQAAGLNAATWDRIESGQVVREDRLVAALKALWPESGGDWTMVGRRDQPGPVFAGQYADPDYLTNIESWLTELQERLEAVEGYIAKRKEYEDAGDAEAEKTSDHEEGRRPLGEALEELSDPGGESGKDGGDVIHFPRPRQAKKAARRVDPNRFPKGLEDDPYPPD